MTHEERLRELEKKYDGFKVYDNNGDSIGKVDDLFVDEQDREEYIGVKMGLFGLSGTTLIPIEMIRVNEQDSTIEVSESKERVKDAPHYNDDDDIDPGFEDRIRSHFGLSSGSGATGSYGQSTDTTGSEGAMSGDNTMRGGDQGTGESQSRESMGREEYRNDENYVSDSAMGAAAGGATGSGGMSGFETGDRESRGTYRESDQDEQQGQSGGGEASDANVGMEDERYRKGYREGYREALRESGQSSGGTSGSMGSGEDQGGSSGDGEGASSYTGTSSSEPGSQDYQDTQDYESSTAGSQPGSSESGEGGGRMRVRRLRRNP